MDKLEQSNLAPVPYTIPSVDYTNFSNLTGILVKSGYLVNLNITINKTTAASGVLSMLTLLARCVPSVGFNAYCFYDRGQNVVGVEPITIDTNGVVSIIFPQSGTIRINLTFPSPLFG